MNRVTIMGRLGRDPELRYTQSGMAVANMSVATNESFVKDGERQKKTEWHRVTVWGATAENASKYLTKGRQVLIEGRLETREWEDKNGEARKTTEIVANRVEFIGGRSDGADDNAGTAGREGAPSDDGAPGPQSANDDIPF